MLKGGTEVLEAAGAGWSAGTARRAPSWRSALR